MASLSPIMEEIFAEGHSVEITVTGRSMEPLLWDRTSRVRLTSVQELRRGDVLLYRRDDGAFVLHRVVSREEDTFTCCGDAQWWPEPGLRPDQALAVMTHFSRKGEGWTSCQTGGYGLYWRVWLFVRPLRRLVFGGMRRVLRTAGFHTRRKKESNKSKKETRP